MMLSISLKVATKDRPDDLRRLLESLRCQMVGPDEIVVVDASREPVEPNMAKFSKLITRCIRHYCLDRTTDYWQSAAVNQ
jgi:hypothetical protein